MNYLIPSPVLAALNRLHTHGHEAYVVGGAVRDLLLSRHPILDWDITTSATPEDTLALFPGSFSDNAFGTVMLDIKHLYPDETTPSQLNELDVLDITTYRSESGYSNNRHPDQVSWGKSLSDDVSRRDFTINALALKVDLPEIDMSQDYQEVSAQVLDYCQGEKDLSAKIIRTVGDPELRFGEDALRMMRAVRLAAQLGFGIEAQTLSAIKTKSSLLAQVSKERIRDEFFKILASPYPADGVVMLTNTELLQHVIPELLSCIGVRQVGRHRHDVYTHSLESLRHCPSPDPLVRLATLLHDIGKPKSYREQGPRGVTFYGHEVIGAKMVAAIADRLRVSKAAKKKLVTLVRWHMFTYTHNMTDAAIRRFIVRVGKDSINDMIMLRIGDRLGGGSRATSWRLQELQTRIGENLYQPLGLSDLSINGHDLMSALKLTPGPHLGKILNHLFEGVMTGAIENQRQPLLEAAKVFIATASNEIPSTSKSQPAPSPQQ